METQYRIQVIGHLPANWAEWLEPFQIACQPDGTTTQTGPIRDQAELYGLVARLQNLGLTLLSVNPAAETHETETL